MKKVYCTIFDSYYLARGVMMLRSLERHGNPQDLTYVFCFDDHTHQVLKELKISKVVPVSLREFETPELLKIKKGRTVAEYCWTCKASAIIHVIEKCGEAECTYLDADLYFYQNPTKGFEVRADQSVSITDHRFSPQYNLTSTSGRFCAQYIGFKKEEKAMKLLHFWNEQCLEWCFNRIEDGKFGDQKYLEAWPAKGDWVQVLEHPGVGLAPWNIQQSSPRTVDPVFFHFHSLTWYVNDLFFLGAYNIPNWAVDYFFRPYIREWTRTSLELKNKFNTSMPKSALPKNKLKYLAKRILYFNRYLKVSL